jgi:dolichol-phosphate mannosyltransferase
MKPVAQTVWLILPAFNEAVNLPILLDRVEAAFKGFLPFRVLVIDDGSDDDTASVAATASERLPITIVRHGKNRGLAAAVRTGIQEACLRAAEGDAVVIMDSDNSHPPELVPEMVRNLDAGYDIVIASRFVRGGRQEGVPWRRRLLSRTAGLIFRGIWPIRGVRDYTTGFRAYRAAMLKMLWAAYAGRLIEATGFSVMTEILLKARPLRPRVIEIPLVLRYDLKKGPSKMRLARTIRDYWFLFGRGLRSRKPFGREGATDDS